MEFPYVTRIFIFKRKSTECVKDSDSYKDRTLSQPIREVAMCDAGAPKGNRFSRPRSSKRKDPFSSSASRQRFHQHKTHPGNPQERWDDETSILFSPMDVPDSRLVHPFGPADGSHVRQEVGQKTVSQASITSFGIHPLATEGWL